MHATRSVAVNFWYLAKLIFGKVAVKFNLRGQEFGKFGYRETGRERATEDKREKEKFKMTVEMMCALIPVCLFTQPTFCNLGHIVLSCQFPLLRATLKLSYTAVQ